MTIKLSTLPGADPSTDIENLDALSLCFADDPVGHTVDVEDVDAIDHVEVARDELAQLALEEACKVARKGRQQDA